jgi:hypothetical protein
MRPPSHAAREADIEAVDGGDGRTVACMFRGTYGSYPRRFRQKMLDLTSDALVLRPHWHSLNRTQMTIREPVLSAQVRPRNFKTDWNISEPPRHFRRLHLVRGRWSRGTWRKQLSAGAA